MAGVAELGELVPLADGVVLSPVALIAVVALLLTPRGRANGLAFAAAYVTVGLVATVIAVLGTRGATRGNDQAHQTVTTVLAAGLTAVFVVLAVWAWRGRPRAGHAAKPLRWLATVETLTPPRAAVLGMVLAATAGKNIGLQLRAGTVIDSIEAGFDVLLPVALGFALVSGLGWRCPCSR